jgi:GNAT superfamily N-acetyltransferase
MTQADFPAVEAIGTVVHTAFPESPAIVAERVALYPAGCLVLCGDASVLGYAISHPWRFLHPPRLDTKLGGLPVDPDTYYIHDLALLPEARGTGAGNDAVQRLIEQAISEILGNLSLVAVSGSAPFWNRYGFQVHADRAIQKRLRSYGNDARFMVRAPP